MRTALSLLIFMMVASGPQAFAKSGDRQKDVAVTLKGAKAHDLLVLLEKTNAAMPENSCGAGTCHQEGTLDITCKYPTNPDEKKSNTCEVSARDKKGAIISLSAEKAQKMRNLIASAHAVEDSADDCGAGSCYEKATIEIVCSFPTSGKGPQGSNTSCEVSAAATKAEAANKNIKTGKPAGTR